MPRADMTVQAADADGHDLTLTTIGVDGVAYPWSEQPYVLVVNDTAGAISLTIQTSYAEDGLNLPDFTQSIPANTLRRIFRPRTSPSYKQSDGKVYVDGNGLKVAVFK